MEFVQKGINLILIFLSVSLVPVHGEWTLKGSSPIAVTGTDFVLSCITPQHTAVPPVYVFWSKQDLGSSSVFITTNNCNPDSSIWPSYAYNCDNTNRVYKLTIPGDDVSDLNGVSWRCSNGGNINSNVVPITVLNPVQQIIMNGTTPLVVHVGSKVTIMCTTSPSRPAANVVWYKDTDNITSDATAVVENQAGDKYVTRSYLSLTGNRGDEGKTIKCEGYNGAPYKVSDSATLEIWYVAGPADNPVISGYVNGTVLYENSTTKHEVTCRQSKCNPLCTLTWDCEGLNGTNHNTQTEAVSVIQIPLQRQYNGKTCKCTATHTSLAYTEHVSVIFTIHYPPDVHIELVNVTEYETNVKLVCVASGVPPVYNYIGWKQMIGDSIVRTTLQFTGLSDDRRVLTFDNVTFADAGLYSCEVSNNVKSPQTATAYFDVKATAKFKPDTEIYTFYSGIGQTLVVTIPFFSNPPAKAANIKWFNLNDNSVIGNDKNTTFDLVYSPFNISLYSVALSLQGQIARMHISSLQNNYLGNYSVSIANGLSTLSSVNFWILLRDRPHRPFGIRAVCTSVNTAEVIWVSKFNGGSIQHFNIVVRVSENVLFQLRENIHDTGKDEIISSTIYNLDDGTLYFFTVYAENDYGQSAPTDVFNCSTPKKDTRVLRCETEPNTASIVLFVISSIFIVCGTIVFTVRFFIERRKNKLFERKKKGDKALDLTNTYQELGEREQPLDKPYQEISSAAAENRKDERNVYQEISGRDSFGKQHGQVDTIIGQLSESGKGNVYDELAKRDRPNVYENIKC